MEDLCVLLHTLRPGPEDGTEVLSEVLRAVRLSARAFGRFELSALWALHVRPHSQRSVAASVSIAT